ncbi:MAG: long-chain-fatty-acid--CoA ligase [Acidimicrobiales bacterium]
MATERWGLAEFVRTNGRERPDGPAITFGSEVLTWRDLDERSSRVANALSASGLGAGDRIAFFGKNTPIYFDVLFGAAKIGAITVAVNWRLSAGEAGFIINDAGAKVLFIDTEFETVFAALDGSLTTAKTVVAFGDRDDELAGAEPFQWWLVDAGTEDPGHVGSADEVAIQLYTSGTTGLPKGAMLSNSSMALLNGLAQPMFGIDERSTTIVALPTFHIGGAGYALVGMAQGAHTILLRDFDPAIVLEALAAHQVTNAFFVPAMLAALSAVPGAADRDYSALRSIVYGASPITDETLKSAIRTFGCEFFQVYGMTETTGAITRLGAEDHDPDGPRAHLLRSAGKPFEWVEMRIVDPDTGEDKSAGEVGELWTRSPQNMAGYWNNADATAQTITADGWLRTGDAGFRDAEGYLFLTDRIKDMVVTGGENVYPIEVENVLADHPAVADVAVIGVPDPRWGETIKAIVVLRPGAPAAPAELIAFARDRIAHFKCPTSVDFIDVLPRNPSGKILKRELREPYWVGHERRVS